MMSKKIMLKCISVMLYIVCFFLPVNCDAEEDIVISEYTWKNQIGTPYIYTYVGNDTYYLKKDNETYFMRNGEITAFEFPDELKKNYEPQWRYSTGVRAVPYGGNGIFVMYMQSNIPTINKHKGYSVAPTFIFDENFVNIRRYQQEGEIINMFFQDGYFYFETESISDEGKAIYTMYKTQDFIDVEQCDFINKKIYDNDIINVELSETRMPFVGLVNPQRVFFVDNTGFSYPVEYENPNISFNTINKIIYNSKNNTISQDGIYWYQYDVANKVSNFNFSHAWLENDTLFYECEDKIYESPMIYKYNPYVRFNNKILGFEEPPIIEDGRTLVPMRFLFEQMGANVDWNAETQTATATLDNTAVTFAIDNTEAEVNSQPVTMDVPAQLVNGKTMVPLRFLSEELGFTVTWDEETRTAVIE